MEKISLYSFIGVKKGKLIDDMYLNGALVELILIYKPVFFVEKILNQIGIYLNTKKTYFWCPTKEILSLANYGSMGKRSRGKYSNLWFVVDNADVTILKKTQTKLVPAKLHKLTNKKMKEHLDKYLPAFVIPN